MWQLMPTGYDSEDRTDLVLKAAAAPAALHPKHTVVSISVAGSKSP